MDHPFLVSVVNGLTNLKESLQPIAQIKLMSFTVLVDRYTFNHFHDKIRLPMIGCRAIEHAGDMRVIQHCQRLSLSMKSIQYQLRVHSLFHEFQCDPPRDGGDLLRLPNGPHASFAQEFEKLVSLTDQLPGGRHRRDGIRDTVSDGFGDGLGFHACGGLQ